VSITYCIDPRCTTSQRCQREANERYGNAPGVNYGPRCIPAPPSVGQTYEQGIAEGERRERAAVVAMLRGYANSWGTSPDEKRVLHSVVRHIQRCEHRREEKP
jgi:hypothetical protein